MKIEKLDDLTLAQKEREKDFDIPTGDMGRDYEMLRHETFLEFYGDDY